MRKDDRHIFKGMSRDVSVSKQDAQFLWDANNIRLTARDGDTMMSLTNERGTTAIQPYWGTDNLDSDFNRKKAALEGRYVGHCVVGDYLVLFTTDGYHDHIYRIEKKTDDWDGDTKGQTIYEAVTLYGDGEGQQPLGFSADHPLQTLGVYENKAIQKVYWTDGGAVNYDTGGKNQPRVINITKVNPHYNSDSFDFVPAMRLKDSVTVRKIADSSGSFGAGVIQYFVTYYNKYLQQSNISCSSPLIPTSFMSRAGSAEDKIGNSFEVRVKNPDLSFEYMRVYSVFRSSIDATPSAKRVIDIRLGDGGDSEPEAVQTITNPVQTPYVRYAGAYTLNGVAYRHALEVKLDVGGGWWKLGDDALSAYGVAAEDAADPSELSCGIDFGSAASGDGGFVYYHFTKSANPCLVLCAYVAEEQTNGNVRTIKRYITWSDTATDLYVGTQTGVPGPGSALYQIIVANKGGSVTVADYVSYADADNDFEVTFVDNNTIGDSIEPEELLYVGGETITAETLTQKDGTLFLGNIAVQRNQIDDSLKERLSENAVGDSDSWSATRQAAIPLAIAGDTYRWGSQLNAKVWDDSGKTVWHNVPTAGFKSREHYRLGVQFQYKSGKWSEPVFLADKTEDNRPSLNEDQDTLTIPTFKAALDADSCAELLDSGYVRARALVVLPGISDRLVIAQGMLAPSVYSLAARSGNVPYYQSSWFFRPWAVASSDICNNDTSNVWYGSSVAYKHNQLLFGFMNRGAEIQGVPMNWGGLIHEDDNTVELPEGSKDTTVALGTSSTEDTVTVGIRQCGNIFCVDQQNVTMHSPDFEFDDSFASLDLASVKVRTVGLVRFKSNVGNIDIQTETPAIGDSSEGFSKQTLSVSRRQYADKRLAAGLFYRDELVDDDKENGWGVAVWEDNPTYTRSYLVYPWHRSGSLNNDCARPLDMGTRTAVLSQKTISNLKFADMTDYDSSAADLALATDGSSDDAGLSVQLFNQDCVALLKTAGRNYYGSVDTLLTPAAPYGTVLTVSTNNTVFDLGYSDFRGFNKSGLYYVVPADDSSDNMKFSWGDLLTTAIGNETAGLRQSRETVSMKYKSTPHAAISLAAALEDPGADAAALYMGEVYRDANESVDFGGATDQAKQQNLWIPAGEPVALDSSGTQISWDWGDTWFQRYDCLKTYPYTEEDKNQIVEIGSFMVETHVNIDGRYDRNRGQDDNLAMSPVNFNLINTVYSQTDNFFNYRILDSDYYKLSEFPAMVAWSTAKSNGSEVDPWTTVSLSSTLEIDGTRGQITDLAVFKDTLYAFQETGITQILFNSRVAISTSDNVPIEISNNYKVDGSRYISTAVGCRSKFEVAVASQGLYFIDSVGKTLYMLAGDQMQNVSDTKGLGYWFSRQAVDESWRPPTFIFAGATEDDPNIYSICESSGGIRLDYDPVNSDLYVITNDTALCYSELLGQFVSFLDYQGADALFNIGGCMYAATTLQEHTARQVDAANGDTVTVDSYTPTLWSMFTGERNRIFSSRYPSDFTFVSNADMALDKIFTNVELRADFSASDNTSAYMPTDIRHFKIFDTIRVWNEYQDTLDTAPDFIKKFRIWRCTVPRVGRMVTVTDGAETREELKRGVDRIRNTWCKVKLSMNTPSKLDTDSGGNPLPHRMELHDVGVVYYV